jgi:ketosteroid isomerase-like protein
MSQENVELARAALARWVEVDEGLVAPERLLEEFFAQDAIATFSGFGPIDEQTFRTLEFLEFRASWMEPYEDFRYEPTEILEAGEDQVVVVLHQRGRPHGSDSWVQMNYGMVYTVDGKLITRADFYATPEAALDAVGLQE